MWMVMKGRIRAEHFTVLEGKWFMPNFLDCNTDVLYLKKKMYFGIVTHRRVYTS